MKKLLIITMLLVAAINTQAQRIYMPKGVELKNRGIISELTYWKENVENKTIRVLNDQRYNTSSDVTGKVVGQYLDLKRDLDAAVNQLEYNVNLKKGLVRQFDELDWAYRNWHCDHCCKHEQHSCVWSHYYRNINYELSDFSHEVKKYIQGCNKYVNMCDSLINIRATEGSVAMKSLNFDTPAPLDVMNTVWSIYKDIKERRDKLATNFISILEKVQLAELNSVMETKVKPAAESTSKVKARAKAKKAKEKKK
jgi:hypothetical protein